MIYQIFYHVKAQLKDEIINHRKCFVVKRALITGVTNFEKENILLVSKQLNTIHINMKL